MVPVATRQPGHVAERGAIYAAVQGLKSLINGRFDKAVPTLRAMYPHVAFHLFQPGPDTRRVMAGSPMKYFYREELVEMGFRETTRDIRANRFPQLRRDFDRHGVQFADPELRPPPARSGSRACASWRKERWAPCRATLRAVPTSAEKRIPIGPFRADDIRPGEPYEVSDGYRIECMGTGQRGSRSNGAGFMVLDSDPDAPAAGVDAGVAPVPTMLRAPDIAVGGLADEPGWSPTAPPLAVEYADRGQDERELEKKIVELLRCGTRFVWVVRLSGPRRVEVHTPGADVRTLYPGDQLTAPGILKNAVPVDALYDREAAHRHTLRNLLQREGYEDLDAVKGEGRDEGREEGRLVQARAALRRVLARRKLALSAEEDARIDGCASLEDLERWHDAAVDAASAADALR